MNDLAIIGASGHGKVLADIAQKSGYTNIVFLDDNPAVRSCGDYRVIGSCNEALLYRDFDFIVAIGDAGIRRAIQSKLNGMGLHIVSLIHPSAVIAPHTKIGVGSAVMAGAVINPYAELGQGCIVNTCASVDHDCRIGDYVHIAVGAHVAGTVTIGDNTWVGASATISNNICVTADCMIGAGAVVVDDLEQAGTYIGVPARRMDIAPCLHKNGE